MERENARLREEMRANVDEFQRQMEVREARALNQKGGFQASEITQMLKKENEAYKSENRLLRDKIA